MAHIALRSAGRQLVVAVAVVLGAGLAASCNSGGGKPNKTAPTTARGSTATSSDGATTTDGSPTSTTLKTAGQPGLFDFNQDGTKEPTCGTADFKAGLTVRTYCDDLSGYANEPAAGAKLVPGALFSLPTPPDDPRDKPITEGASVDVLHLQSTQGKEVVVLTLSADTVFEVGSDRLRGPALDSLGAMATGIESSYPGATIEVRGHTDSSGSVPANQSLSERRAAAVSNYFGTKGIDKAKLSAVGLGQAVPNYLEKNPDGSDSPVGRDQNRRIEIVIRPA